MEEDNSLQGVKESHDRKEAAGKDHLFKGHFYKRKVSWRTVTRKETKSSEELPLLFIKKNKLNMFAEREN